MLRDAKASYARAQSLWDCAVARARAVTEVTGLAVTTMHPPAVAVGADSTTYQLAATELEAAAEKVSADAGDARESAARVAHETQIQRMLHRLAAEQAPAGRAVASAPQSHRPAEHPAEMTATTDEIDRDRVKDRVGRRLAELARLDHHTDRLEVLVTDIAEADSQSRIDLLIGELDFEITQARTAAVHRTAREAAHSELVALRARLDNLSTPDVTGLRRSIDELLSTDVDQVPADLVASVDRAVRAADAEADRRHVASAMQDALEKLGYAIGPEFSTDLVGAQGAAFARNGSSRYGLKLRLEPGAARFTAQAVKSDAALTTAAEDLAAEHTFCDALDSVIELARHDGVELDLDIETEPGVCAVQQVADERLARPAAGARRVARQEMKRTP
jgi:hypothetical protein